MEEQLHILFFLALGSIQLSAHVASAEFGNISTTIDTLGISGVTRTNDIFFGLLCDCPSQELVDSRGDLILPDNVYHCSFLSCLFRITLPGSTKSVEFLLDSEYFSDTSNTSFEIYDYDPGDENSLIANISGRAERQNIQSGSKRISVLFQRSAPDFLRGRIIGKYREATETCGGQIDFSQGSLLASPNYPYNYPNNAECRWVLQVPSEEGIAIEFPEGVETEYCSREKGAFAFDVVTIFEGPPSETPIARLCGTNGTDQVIRSPTKHSLTVLFRSDARLMNRGFFAKFYPIPRGFKSCQCEQQELTIDSYHSNGVAFASKDFPEPYCNNMDCSWILKVPKGQRILLAIETLKVGDPGDRLLIYDGPDIEGYPKMGEFSRTPEGGVVSSGERLTLLFVSNERKTAEGFSARFSSVPPTYVECGVQTINLQPTRGNNLSLELSHSQRKDLDCIWILRTGKGYRLRVRVEQLAENPTPAEARSTRLSVFDGTLDTLGEKLAGFRISSMKDSVLGNSELTLRLQARKSGFKALVDVIDEGYCPHEKIKLKPGGTVTLDPSMVSFFSENIKGCGWTVRAEGGDWIQLKVLSYRSDSFERLNIYAGSPGHMVAMETLYGGENSARDLVTGTGYMDILIPQDFHPSTSWFQIAVSAVSSGEVVDVSSSRGTLLSPSFPQPYPPNSLFQWRIRAASHWKTLKLVFRQFHTEASYDLVTIKTREGVRIRQYSGSLEGTQLSPCQSELWIEFQTDDWTQVTDTGFVLEFYETEKENCEVVVPEGSQNANTKVTEKSLALPVALTISIMVFIGAAVVMSIFCRRKLKSREITREPKNKNEVYLSSSSGEALEFRTLERRPQSANETRYGSIPRLSQFLLDEHLYQAGSLTSLPTLQLASTASFLHQAYHSTGFLPARVTKDRHNRSVVSLPDEEDAGYISNADPSGSSRSQLSTPSLQSSSADSSHHNFQASRKRSREEIHLRPCPSPDISICGKSLATSNSARRQPSPGPDRTPSPSQEQHYSSRKSLRGSQPRLLTIPEEEGSSCSNGTLPSSSSDKPPPLPKRNPRPKKKVPAPEVKAEESAEKFHPSTEVVPENDLTRRAISYTAGENQTFIMKQLKELF